MKRLQKLKLVLLTLLILTLTIFNSPQLSAEEASPSLDDGYKYIALTFDDGPHTANDARILNALNEVNGQATFFQVGYSIPYNLKGVKAILDQGSEIGNHSYDHPAFTTLSAQGISNQIAWTNNLLQENFEFTPQLVRPPYGDINDAVLANLPYPVILWSVDTLDWKYRDPYYVAEQIRSASAGSIVLLHSIHESTATAVEMVLEEMYLNGYRFVTVSELFRIYGKTLNPYTIYYSAY